MIFFNPAPQDHSHEGLMTPVYVENTMHTLYTYFSIQHLFSSGGGTAISARDGLHRHEKSRVLHS